MNLLYLSFILLIGLVVFTLRQLLSLSEIGLQILQLENISSMMKYAHILFFVLCLVVMCVVIVGLSWNENRNQRIQ